MARYWRINVKLGIDFGTTHTVAAIADQGNFPVVFFSSPAGDWYDFFPSLIAIRAGETRFGFEAYEVIGDPQWTVIRSVKSLLKHIDRTKQLEIEGHSYGVLKLLVDYLSAFKRALRHASSIDSNPLSFKTSVAVPANTNNQQRFVTAEAFTSAGFDLLNMLNEPSAATMEYTSSVFKHVERSNKKYLLVYDLGGGTFDASIAEIQDKTHRIIATEGLENLGGDQFDEILAEMVLEQFNPRPELTFGERVRLLELAREKKEALTPQSRTILLEWHPNEGVPLLVRVPVKDYFDRCEPLVQKTVEVVQNLAKRIDSSNDLEEFSAIYLVGGMSSFPLIARNLKHIYGQHKVKKSHHCNSAVAIGLAILSDRESEIRLQESLTRHFGLWREADDGESLVFDRLFEKDQPLPPRGEPALVLRRRYRPSHNIGIFRFQECGFIEDDRPAGLVTVWNQILFSFAPGLEGTNLLGLEVTRYEHPFDFEVEEIYSLSAEGEISFKIINHHTGYSETFQLTRTSGIG